MRPIKVEFQAFGPYVGREEVNFEALSSKGLFLICGKTGIGKTMILDAMTFALYGKSSGHGRDEFEAMRCTNADRDTTTFVLFEFENNGEIYRFERRLERKRVNLSAAYNLMKKGKDGKWRVLLENAKEKLLNEKAAEIIGLEYEQFRQVIVLPQGQFERLLTSKSEEKEKILTSIFGEEKWQIIAEYFYDEVVERRNNLKGIRERINKSLSEENCENFLQMDLLIRNKKDRVTKMDEEYRAKNYEGVIKAQQEALVLANRFADLHRTEQQESDLKEKQEERNEWEKELKNAKRADKVRSFLNSVKDSELELKKREKDLETAENAAEKAGKTQAEAAEALKRHIEKEADTEKKKILKAQYESKRGDYEGLDEAEKDLKKKSDAVSECVEKENIARELYDALSKMVVELKNDYSELQNEHDILLNDYLSGITGELAKDLKTGEPCPVCGSTEHPNKAHVSEKSVTKSKVDSQKKKVDAKYKELQDQMNAQEEAKKDLDKKHEAVENAGKDVIAAKTYLDGLNKNLVPEIHTLKMLNSEIKKIEGELRQYVEMKEKLESEEKKSKEAYTAASTRITAAKKEEADADIKYKEAMEASDKSLKENGFDSEEEALKMMKTSEEMDELNSKIANYDAEVESVKNHLASIKTELKGKEEPDREKCNELLDQAMNERTEYEKNKAVLLNEVSRLEKKVSDLRKEGSGIEEKLREAEEDYVFAKKLRGDTGTGLQRYVLGIMFSSVVTAANKMLELVHGGRYRLYRSDDKAQGSNKRGLELKVFDRNSGDHEGRFVRTLSGGEKFLASLALSIGMSTVAQRSGIRIEAIFIDEGFGSLDDESIGDAMSVLNSIREANGLVGIISHVQILQDQIPSKIRVTEDSHGSHIEQLLG